VTIADEFQNLFAFLRDTAVDKALDQDIPLAGAALQAVPAALFSALQADIAEALDGVGGRCIGHRRRDQRAARRPLERQ
jgi:hypothetical protein